MESPPESCQDYLHPFVKRLCGRGSKPAGLAPSLKETDLNMNGNGNRPKRGNGCDNRAFEMKDL